MKIALAQLNSNNHIDHNLRLIMQLVESAVGESPAIIFFPENSLFFRLSSTAQVEALKIDGEVFNKLSALATQTGIALHLTTAIEDQGKIYNASVLIRPKEKPVILYRKIHLFDIALKDQKPIKESVCFARGSDSNIFEFDGFSFGSSICYDIRFSELYLRYAKTPVDVILIPSAFLVKTGEAHWQVLIRARAIESQCYVLAPAQSGRHTGQDVNQFRETYGNSLAVDPWGKIIAQRESGTGLVYVSLDKNEISAVRQQIPMNSHRRI